MDNNFGVKDIYQGMLLAARPMVINGVEYKEDDVVLLFDSIQAISFQESSSSVYSRGGFDNRRLISWTTTQQIDCALDMGRISQAGYGIVNKEVLKGVETFKSIRSIETYSLEDGIISLLHEPLEDMPVRIFKKGGMTIEKEILDFSIEGSTIRIEGYEDCDVLIDYYFKEDVGINLIPIGKKQFNGIFKFVGKFYYTNEQSSSRKTAIIEIPRLEITNDFNITLGRNINPLITTMMFTAIPVGDRRNTKTLQILYLDKDIDGNF